MAAGVHADYVATGHYAQVEYHAPSGRYRMKRAVDAAKDQTYFLFGLTQQQLSRTQFPLGGMTKPQVRELAKELGVPIHAKADSQEICFVPNGDYAAFIDSYFKEQGIAARETHGEIVSTDGEVLGGHAGVHHYTVGQRRGLGISAAEPLYVIATESGNRSELSACGAAGDTNASTACTLGLNELIAFATNPNLPNNTKHIQTDPDVPDRDLFVFDTTTGAEVTTVSGIGTLLNGIAVSNAGRAFITQTDARNVVNGNHGQTLSALGNRMFNNKVAAVTCTGGSCGAVQQKDLEPANPTDATALVRWGADEELSANFGRYPALSTARADAAGFRHDGDARALVRSALA